VTARVALGDYIPWPFVGVAVLLVVFILVTPVLLSISSPGLTSNAELIVDRSPSGTGFNFYVRAIGTTDRYTEVRLGLATGFAWDGIRPVPWSGLDWTSWTNQSDTLEIETTSAANPVAVNVSAQYVSSGGNALYVGVLAFYVAGNPVSGQTLFIATATSGISVPSSAAFSNVTLPLAIRLASSGSGSS